MRLAFVESRCFILEKRKEKREKKKEMENVDDHHIFPKQKRKDDKDNHSNNATEPPLDSRSRKQKENILIRQSPLRYCVQLLVYLL